MLDFFKKLFSNNTEDLKAIVNDGAYLVDVRSKAEYESGHVKGSANIPLDQIQQHIGKFKNKKNVVVFCRSGMRASQAKSILQQNGISNVVNAGTWQKVNNLLKQ
ncbi:MAG: rhodanese-like domain-containing protein [Ferruginibacter sp.]|nr:rhodanese-like domain-containing protein [Ferruginibacter sp.]